MTAEERAGVAKVLLAIAFREEDWEFVKLAHKVLKKRMEAKHDTVTAYEILSNHLMNDDCIVGGTD